MLKKTIINGKEVVVLGNFADVALESHQFKEWIPDMDKRFDIKSIDFKSIIFSSHHKAPKVRFATFESRVAYPDGNLVDRTTFMRGGSVVILPVLTCEGTEHTILTVQPRFSIGQFDFPELPAGTIEGGSFVGEAAREFLEEATIEIKEEDLVDLHQLIYEKRFGKRFKGVYATPGGSDEFFRIFLFRREVDRNFIESLRGKLTGLASENEQIALRVIPFRNLPLETPDAKSLSAFVLYNTAKELGLV